MGSEKKTWRCGNNPSPEYACVCGQPSRTTDPDECLHRAPNHVNKTKNLTLCHVTCLAKRRKAFATEQEDANTTEITKHTQRKSTQMKKYASEMHTRTKSQVSEGAWGRQLREMKNT